MIKKGRINRENSTLESIVKQHLFFNRDSMFKSELRETRPNNAMVED